MPHAKGSANGASRLTEDDVRYIRKHYRFAGPSSNVSNVMALAEKFGIAKHTVRSVASGETWGWLE